MISGNLFIITAASGAGKTSLVRALLEKESGIRISISHTTRRPRPSDVDGKDYHFVTDEQFIEMLEAGGFLESAQVHNARYGTSEKAVNEALSAGDDVILEIDWQGAAQVRKIYPEAVTIFILPPSLEILEARLRNRGQDSDDVIAKRLAAAREEMRHLVEFDYVTINDKFEDALQDLIAIIQAQRLNTQAQIQRHQSLIQTLT